MDEDNPVRVIDVFVDGLDLADLRFIGVYITPTVARKGAPSLARLRGRRPSKAVG